MSAWNNPKCANRKHFMEQRGFINLHGRYVGDRLWCPCEEPIAHRLGHSWVEARFKPPETPYWIGDLAEHVTAAPPLAPRHAEIVATDRGFQVVAGAPIEQGDAYEEEPAWPL